MQDEENLTRSGELINRTGTERNAEAHIPSIPCLGSASTIIRQSATDPAHAFRRWFLSSTTYFSLVLLSWKVEATKNSAESKCCHISSIPGIFYGIMSVLHLSWRNIEGQRSSFTKQSYWMTTDRNRFLRIYRGSAVILLTGMDLQRYRTSKSEKTVVR